MLPPVYPSTSSPEDEEDRHEPVRHRPSTPIYQGGSRDRSYRLQRPKQLRDALFDRMCDWGYHTLAELDGWMPDRQWIKAICDLVSMGYTFDSNRHFLRLRKRREGEPEPKVVSILSGFLLPTEYGAEDAHPIERITSESEPVEVPFQETEVPEEDRLYLDDAKTFSVSLSQLSGDVTGILASRGAGKTYLAMGIAESFLWNEIYDIQWVWLDPMGIAWGLLADENGRPHDKDIVLLGGERGHRPLRPDQGKMVARAVMGMRPIPFVLDMRDWEKEQQHELAADFLNEIYVSNGRIPIHLFVDEADVFAPQTLTASKHHKRCLEAMDDIVRRGRNHGLGSTIISQRPAAVNKMILSQTHQMFLLKSGAPHDLEATAKWFSSDVSQEQVEECLRALTVLQIGTAYYACNGANFRFGKFKVKKRRTFDSSYSPKPLKKIQEGEIRETPDKVVITPLRAPVAEALDGFLGGAKEEVPEIEDDELETTE
jgi:hypothetical protein